jgi:hypothetical protein
MLCTESVVTSKGLKTRSSERDVTGPARVPLASVNAAEEAVKRPFMVGWRMLMT